MHPQYKQEEYKNRFFTYLYPFNVNIYHRKVKNYHINPDTFRIIVQKNKNDQHKQSLGKMSPHYIKPKYFPIKHFSYSTFSVQVRMIY